MLDQNHQILSTFKLFFGTIVLVIIVFSGNANARSLDAGYVLKEMNSDQQFGYIAGAIEGLATARWVKDKPNDTGLKCIYDWFYKSGELKWNILEQVLNKYPDQKVGAILYALTKKDCGT